MQRLCCRIGFYPHFLANICYFRFEIVNELMMIPFNFLHVMSPLLPDVRLVFTRNVMFIPDYFVLLRCWDSFCCLATPLLSIYIHVCVSVWIILCKCSLLRYPFPLFATYHRISNNIQSHIYPCLFDSCAIHLLSLVRFCFALESRLRFMHFRTDICCGAKFIWSATSISLIVSFCFACCLFMHQRWFMRHTKKNWFFFSQ